MRCSASVKHRLEMRLASAILFLLSLAQCPPPPLQFTGRVFSNGGSAAFPLLPYIIYARRGEVALLLARVPVAKAEETRRPRLPWRLPVSDNKFI